MEFSASSSNKMNIGVMIQNQVIFIHKQPMVYWAIQSYLQPNIVMTNRGSKMYRISKAQFEKFQPVSTRSKRWKTKEKIHPFP